MAGAMVRRAGRSRPIVLPACRLPRRPFVFCPEADRRSEVRGLQTRRCSRRADAACGARSCRPSDRRYPDRHGRLRRGGARRAPRARLPRRRRARDVGLPGADASSVRCCSRARRASARPRWPRCSPRGPAASWCGCSATRASTPPRPLYEWDYSRQLLHLRATEAAGAPVVEDELYSERFLVRRPLLRAIDHARYAAGAAGRRGRPGRRRVRGVPARDPLRLHGDDPRARRDPRRGAAGGGPHLEPDAATCTTRSSAGASTTGSTIPTSSARSRSCELKAPGVGGPLAARGGRRGRGAARPRPVQAARRRRDDRLGDARSRGSA